MKYQYKIIIERLDEGFGLKEVIIRFQSEMLLKEISDEMYKLDMLEPKKEE